MEKEEKEKENYYAFDGSGEVIFIGNVPFHENGIKRDYYCLGCKKQMQAVLPQTERKRHFRHHVTSDSNTTKCTYSDETYRHELAKKGVFFLKKIKVPSVYKYPPDKFEGIAHLISESLYIEAHFVLLEHYIFEDALGNIIVSNSKEGWRDGELLIKPDAVFMDNQYKPILIIEFVATHKPNFEKIIKLKRLRIDAIQVSVPKSSPEEIQEIFHTAQRTKWLFNNDEDCTDYFQIPKPNASGIFEIDKIQRGYFEEGFKCREAQIGDFIRSIRRVLESEQYKQIERNIESKISRTEGNTERERAELERIRGIHWAKGVARHQEFRNQVESKRSDLERRYFNKKRQLVEETRGIEFEIAKVEIQYTRDYGGRKTTSADVERGQQVNENTRREIERIEQSIREKQEDLDFFQRSYEQEFGDKERAIDIASSEIKNRIANLPNEFDIHCKREIEHTKTAIENRIRENEREIIAIEIRGKELPESFERNKSELCERNRDNKIQLLDKLERGDVEAIPEIKGEISRLYNLRRALEDYQYSKDLLDRIEHKIGKYH